MLTPSASASWQDGPPADLGAVGLGVGYALQDVVEVLGDLKLSVSKQDPGHVARSSRIPG
jgi:hypothetical protein